MKKKWRVLSCYLFISETVHYWLIWSSIQDSRLPWTKHKCSINLPSSVQLVIILLKGRQKIQKGNYNLEIHGHHGKLRPNWHTTLNKNNQENQRLSNKKKTPKIRSDLMCSGRVSTSCSICVTYRVKILITFMKVWY